MHEQVDIILSLDLTEKRKEKCPEYSPSTRQTITGPFLPVSLDGAAAAPSSASYTGSEHGKEYFHIPTENPKKKTRGHSFSFERLDSFWALPIWISREKLKELRISNKGSNRNKSRLIETGGVTVPDQMPSYTQPELLGGQLRPCSSSAARGAA